MSDYLKGMLSVPALALGVCVLLIGLRIFLALSDKLIEIGVMRLTKESTKHQRAAIASATYSAPRSWTLAGRSVGITFFVGMDTDDLIWAANRLTEKEVGPLKISRDFERRMRPADERRTDAL